MARLQLALAALVGALWIDLPVAAVMQQLSSGVGKVSMLTVPFFQRPRLRFASA